MNADSTSTILRIPTADGAALSIKRYARDRATPVVLIHGLAVNADMWDIPPTGEGPAAFRSLAAALRDAGFDVWLVNLRGHGAPHMPSDAPAGQSDWCVDHFIAYDLPAVFDFVARTSARRPFAIAQSMGAMSLAAYLQGADFDDSRDQIILRDDLSAARQSALAGAVFGELPAALRWPQSLFQSDGKLRWDAIMRDWLHADAAAKNYPFEALARWAWLQTLIESWGEISTNWLRGDWRAVPGVSHLPESWRAGLAGLEKSAMLGVFKLAGLYTGARAERADVVFQARDRVFAGLKAGVLRQLAKSVRVGGFVSALGAPDCIYSDNYQRIVLPALTIVGDRDKIANADITRTVFFERLRSTDKDFRSFSLSHGELTCTPFATHEIYPGIISWINCREFA